jgi:quinohemoprotein amine dehydrogenase
MPRQVERFEAIAVHRGKDGKPYTDDDVDLFQVRPRWSLEEFRVRDDDDDVKPTSARSIPRRACSRRRRRPEPARKWQANNVGDVFVVPSRVRRRRSGRPKKPGAEAGGAQEGRRSPTR